VDKIATQRKIPRWELDNNIPALGDPFLKTISVICYIHLLKFIGKEASNDAT